MSASRLHLRLCVWLLGSVALATTILTVLLVTGQCLKLRGLLAGLDAYQWAPVLGLAVVVLLEAILPLAALIGSALLYGRLRDQGIEIVMGGTGRNPITLLIPVVIIGCFTGLISWSLSTTVGPHAISRLGQELRRGAIASLVQSHGSLDGQGFVSAREESTKEQSVSWLATQTDHSQVSTLIRTENLVGDWGVKGPQLTFGDTIIWSESLKIKVKTGTVKLDPQILGLSMKMFGPPNSLPSSQLDMSLPYHAFTHHRRLVMAVLAPIWSVLGALLGLMFGRLRATLLGACLVGLGYWGLRSGELAARWASYPPSYAAWLPCLGLGLFTLAVMVWWARRRI